MKIIADKYEVIRELGQGGFGVVFLARHRDLGAQYAIKVLDREISLDEGLINRFKREAEVLMRFVHPQSVQLRDFGRTEDGRFYMAMDFCEGDPLREVIDREVYLSPARTLNIAVQILDVLEAAHRAGIVHRDLKPANIIIQANEDGPEIVKVLDFGIAKLREGVEKGATLTKEGSIIGTPEYMSPEQAGGENEIDGRSDLYSLGVVMYEMLTGKSPFKGSTVRQTLMSQITQKAKPFSEIASAKELPSALEKVVFKSIEKEPEDRYQSGEEFRKACEEVHRELPERETVETDITSRPTKAISTPGQATRIDLSPVPEDKPTSWLTKIFFVVVALFIGLVLLTNPALLKLTAAVAICIAVYEMIRYRVVRRLSRRFRRSVRSFIADHDVNIEKSRFMAKQLIRFELVNDIIVHQAMVDHGREHNLPMEDVRDIVEDYIDEIVPAFNLQSYYKVGYSVARTALKLVYNVVLDKENLKQLEDLPENKVHVYIMNHRSNADFVLAAYMLSRHICISFAVGEWARVWPLENLFKSFGSYFVRRGYREPLYHTVLARYLAFITKTALRQGIFIEGGLSRDGRLRPPKFGLIDYITRSLKDPDFDRDILFIPTGINFDRVIEDKNLLAEKHGKGKKKGLVGKAFSLARVLFHGTITLSINAIRVIAGRHKRHGYASVSFGDPISLNDYLEEQGLDLRSAQGDKKKEILLQLSEYLIGKIGEVIPVTPVPLTCRALLEIEGEELNQSQVVSEIQDLRKELRERGGRIVMGREFEWYKAKQEDMEKEREYYGEELGDLDRAIVESEAAEKTFNMAWDLLRDRKILVGKRDGFTIPEDKRELVEYYANSIIQLFDDEEESGKL